MKYKIIDHTADFGLHVFGTDPQDLFANAARAMFELITDPQTGVAEIVIVRRGHSFEARIVPRGDPDSVAVDAIRARLAEILGPEASVSSALVERIDRPGTDKYRVFVDEPS